MPEPQSTLFFLLLMAVFGALVWWLVTTKQTVLRVLAACLAFIPAMMFGVAAVNKYYDYYQNWNAAISDISSQGVQAAEPPNSRHPTAAGLSTFLGSTIDPALAAQIGFTLHLTVHGRLSHITRSVYVYLPPQYFSAAYRTYHFPAIELLHGFPGLPQDWITVMDVTATLKSLIAEGKAKPAILVMPDVNGGMRISLQCLNQVHGPQDATFLTQDLPAYIARILRVQPPGLSWGVAGYSEGGYCAANLGLQYARTFGYAGVLSGYFAPDPNQLGSPPRQVNPFGGNKALQRLNTPTDLLKSLSAGALIPQFWLGAGSADRSDVRSAEIFDQLLQLRQPTVTLKLVPGGGHTALTWRALLTPMLEWMTPDLARQVALAEARALHPTPTPKAARTPKVTRTPSPTRRHPRHVRP